MADALRGGGGLKVLTTERDVRKIYTDKKVNPGALPKLIEEICDEAQ